MSLSFRRRTLEWMEQPGLAESLHRCALDGLGRVNAFTQSSKALWPPIRDLARSVPRPLRILDLGSGGGDVPRAVARRAERGGIRVELSGCDISPVAVSHAQEQIRAARPGGIDFFRLDVVADPFPEGYDVVMCSLLLHHMEEHQAVRLLRKMAGAARHLVLVQDLRRTRLGYALAWAGSRLLTRCPVIHVDGPLSVAAAFTIPEARDLARRSGLGDATIVRCWPQRFLLSWRSR